MGRRGVEGAHRGQARRHGCRDGRLHGRGARGNVIDEPTAPQNLELGQVDLIKTEDLSDRWPQGEAHRGQAHEVRSARPPAAMPGMLLRKATVSALA